MTDADEWNDISPWERAEEVVWLCARGGAAHVFKREQFGVRETWCGAVVEQVEHRGHPPCQACVINAVQASNYDSAIGLWWRLRLNVDRCLDHFDDEGR